MTATQQSLDDLRRELEEYDPVEAAIDRDAAARLRQCRVCGLVCADAAAAVRHERREPGHVVEVM